MGNACTTETRGIGKPVKHINGEGAGVVVVLGAQWGDEGKGKFVHILAATADYCARFNGGDNVVHTINFDPSLTKSPTTTGRTPTTPKGSTAGRNAKSPDRAASSSLQLLPVGVAHPGCENILGNGVVVHLPTLMEELRILKANGLDASQRLWISNRAHLVMDCHRRLDGIFENMRDVQIGTTNRGIGPCYCTKTIRNGIRVGDLMKWDDFAAKFTALQKYFRKLEQENGLPSVDVEKELELYKGYAKTIESMVTDTSLLIKHALQKGSRIVVEGANSSLSDIDFGTYPFVTSSTTTVGGVCTGLGLAPSMVTSVVGVCKSYTTRAQKWFPTEVQTDERIREHLITRGNEKGTKTGKPRRVGWLDLPVVRYSSALNGFDSLVLTKLGVLSGLEKVRLGVEYEQLDGTPHGKRWFPPSLEDYQNVRVRYEELPGWENDISNVVSFESLPAAAKAYVARVSILAELPITWVQVGDGVDSFIPVPP
jgi:adenylosuccinate synthase